MIAEAAQYRETLRIEEQIKNNPEYRRQWSERQMSAPQWDEEETE